MNQAEFYEANQVDGALTTEQTMRMLDLPEGDTPKGDSSVPDADDGKGTPAEVAKVEDKPAVILAKDGVHTIPFEKLTEARAGEQHWKSVAEQAQAALEALKNAPAATQAPAKTEETQAPANQASDEVDFGDYSDEAIRKGVQKLVAIQTEAIRTELESKLNKVVAPIQKSEAEKATEEHFKTIETAHPDFESVVVSKEMNDWIEKQPSFLRPGYRAVIEQGTAPQVVELLDAYKSSAGKPAAANRNGNADSVAAAAQAAIAKAQAAPPSSLSEIPSGSMAHHDPAEAVMEMSTASLMNMFDGKTPEQIKTLLNRSI